MTEKFNLVRFPYAENLDIEWYNTTFKPMIENQKENGNDSIIVIIKNSEAEVFEELLSKNGVKYSAFGNLMDVTKEVPPGTGIPITGAAYNVDLE